MRPTTFLSSSEVILLITTPKFGSRTSTNWSSRNNSHSSQFVIYRIEIIEIFLMHEMWRYANEQQRNGSNFNFLYSTPSCYFKALNDAKKSDWPIKEDDMLPLSYGDHIFWTGYFSSRPSFKFMIRHGSNILRVIIIGILHLSVAYSSRLLVFHLLWDLA